MGKEEFVKEITNIEDDFAQWYTDEEKQNLLIIQIQKDA